MRTLRLDRASSVGFTLVALVGASSCGGRAIRELHDSPRETDGSGPGAGGKPGDTTSTSGGTGGLIFGTGGAVDLPGGGPSSDGTSPTSCDGVDMFDHDPSAATECIFKLICAPGSYVSDDGTATTDRQCTTCPEGTFSTLENAAECLPWTECGSNDVEAPGTSTSDRVCHTWTRQLGTSETDGLRAIDVDYAGNVIVAGQTSGTLPGQPTLGIADVFVRKYDAQGNELWTRQFGTNALDELYGVSVDTDANIYVAGTTTGALPGQTNAGSDDAFLRKYDAQGNELWTRQFGTIAFDFALSVTVDTSGHVYLCGLTSGTMTDAPSAGGVDAFLRKYDAQGNLLDTKQFGTQSFDDCRAVTVDPSGNVLVAGSVTDALPGQTHAGSYNAYVRKYSASGAELWTRQESSSGSEHGNSLGVDGGGNIFLAGRTEGTLAEQTSAGGVDAFLRKYDPSGNVVWSRQVGTEGDDIIHSVSVDPNWNVFVVGITGGAFQEAHGGNDAFVQKYDASGVELWTQQLGTSGHDSAFASSVDAAGYLYVTGVVEGSLPGQASFRGMDGFVIKLGP